MKSTYNYAPGAVHIDLHHNNIAMSASQITDLVRSFITDKDPEDVEPVEEEMPSSELFCRITEEAYQKGKAQQVDEELRSACVSAPKLVKAINTNEALGYVDTKNLPSTQLFKLLNEHYELSFDVRAFQLARSK